MLGNFSCFCCRLLTFFSKSTFSQNSFKNIIRVADGWDPDQDRLFVGPEQGPNCLHLKVSSRRQISPLSESPPARRELIRSFSAAELRVIACRSIDPYPPTFFHGTSSAFYTAAYIQLYFRLVFFMEAITIVPDKGAV